MDAEKLTLSLGDDLYLRPIANGDAEAVLHLVNANYGHLSTFMEWAKPDYALSDAVEWIEKSIAGVLDGSVLNFVIMRGSTLIGAIGFAYFDRGACVTEIGYWIDRNEEGRGIITRATRRLIDLAFDELGMNRVQIRCAAGNLRSAAIPERLGFKKEGVQRQHVIRDGKIYDFWIYGLLRHEWPHRNA